MTQTLIEQLEALPRYNHEMIVWVSDKELRTIIEQHKQEVPEPVGCINYAAASGLKGSPVVWFKSPNSLPDGANIYASPQHDIVAELVKALNWAIENVDMKSVQMDSAKYDALNRARSTLVDARYKVKGVVG